MKTILLKGWGYYDVTRYPYGGCFRRVSEDTQVIRVAGQVGKYPDEVVVRFGNNRTGVVKAGALREVPA